MRILAIGEELNANECRLKFGNANTYFHQNTHQEAKKYLSQTDVVFDFIIDGNRGQSGIYKGITIPIFFNTAKINMAKLTDLDHALNSFGFAGLATFLNRPVFEVSLRHAEQMEKLVEVCGRLKTEFQVVEDSVGLVTPRVICMIINEAYYTVEEGTATREDVDLAMKLGTNYPFGPFEWCRKIGIRDVYELLSRVYEDTKDERYKICPMLKRDYELR